MSGLVDELIERSGSLSPTERRELVAALERELFSTYLDLRARYADALLEQGFITEQGELTELGIVIETGFHRLLTVAASRLTAVDADEDSTRPAAASPGERLLVEVEHLLDSSETPRDESPFGVHCREHPHDPLCRQTGTVHPALSTYLDLLREHHDALEAAALLDFDPQPHLRSGPPLADPLRARETDTGPSDTDDTTAESPRFDPSSPTDAATFGQPITLFGSARRGGRPLGIEFTPGEPIIIASTERAGLRPDEVAIGEPITIFDAQTGSRRNGGERFHGEPIIILEPTTRPGTRIGAGSEYATPGEPIIFTAGTRLAFSLTSGLTETPRSR